MIYAAYGSNTNIEQMKSRCPGAKVIGKARLDCYKLLFRRGYLTVVESKDSFVDVLLWDIDKQNEKSLDVYEGYPTFYYKRSLEVNRDDLKLSALFYIMCEQYISNKDYVTRRYYSTCITGYLENDMDIKPLMTAIGEIYVKKS